MTKKLDLPNSTEYDEEGDAGCDGEIRTTATKSRRCKCCACCATPTGLLILIFFGVLFIVSGAVIMPLVYDSMLKFIVNDMMQLTPSSSIYQEWANPAVPLTSRFYFFDVQNPEEILNGGKPALIERGPYIYKLKVLRENITFNGNGTLSSVPVYQYIFDRDSSVGDESDTFLSINMPMTSTAYMMRDSPSFVKRSMSLILDGLGESMFIRLSVADLLWGYDEPFFELVKKIFPISGVGDQFGFLLGYNNTDINGVFTVYDGVANKSLLNQVNRWKGQAKLDYWFTPEANMMNGTDGMMWALFVKGNETLPLFNQDFCRTMPYVYEADQTYHGVPFRRYYLPPFAYENGTTYPPNKGFCQNDTCAPAGIQRTDPCRFGSPMGLSNPHYLYADPWILDQIIGLNPTEEEHKNYFLLEPHMGMPFVMRQRLQINMFIRNVDGIKQMGNVRTMYVPTIWFAQEVDVPEYVFKTVRLGFEMTGIIATIMGYIFIVIGTFMVLIPATVLGVKYYKKYQQKSLSDRGLEPLLQNSDSDTNYQTLNSDSENGTNQEVI